jgi:hypothetical protein
MQTGKREHNKQESSPRSTGIALAKAVAGTYIGLRIGVAVFHRLRRASLRRCMLDVRAALEAEGLTYWLDFGSLLGIHRDGDLILHDNDVDFACLNPNWAELMPALQRHLEPQYRVRIVTPEAHPESSWVRVYCPLGMIDLFTARSGHEDETGEDAADRIVKVSCGHEDTQHIPESFVLPPGRKHWKGHTISVPANIEETLRHRYGDSWQEPRYQEK